MPRYLLRIGYDGTAYAGWQRQANGVTVQQRLEEAVRPLADTPVAVVGAGRTDAGVHALGQTAHVDLPVALPPHVVLRALNSRLPSDIRVRLVEAVADDLHARYDATGKHYRYQWLVSRVGQPLLERDAWRVPPPLDLAAMRDAASRLVGLHDFAGFRSTGTPVAHTVRAVTSASLRVSSTAETLALAEDESCLHLDIRGTGFLRHMVRAIAGTLTGVGRGRWEPDHVSRILALGDRALAGPTAPAHGLTLVSVDYRADGTGALPSVDAAARARR
jgi:tRNA pseudouridine38-40 synthase